MKFIFFPIIIAFTLLLGLSCQKDYHQKLLKKGTLYKGTYIKSSQYQFSNTWYDTIQFEVVITEDEFTRFHCFGEIEREEDKIRFLSDDCSCYCDCDPRIDCVGDLILGTYNLQEVNDTLKLQKEINLLDEADPLSYRFVWSINLIEQ